MSLFMGLLGNIITPIDKSGTISVNETWSGIIHLTGDVDVASGVELTIAPGTQVIAQGNYVLQGQGQIQAIGTSSNRILFDCALGTWYGVLCGKLGQVQPDVSSVYRFAYCDFKNGKKSSPDLRGSSGDYTYARGAGLCAWECSDFEIDNCTFENCESHTSGGGLYINGSSLGKTYTISNCFFKDCSSATSFGGGFKVDHGGSLVLVNNTFDNNTGNLAPYNDLPVTITGDVVSLGGATGWVGGETIKWNTNPPAPLTAGRDYFVIVETSSSVKIAETFADAKAGTFITLTSAPSGSKVQVSHNFIIFDVSYTLN